MKQYHDILRLILDKAPATTDRTKTGTLSFFGTQTRYDLSEGFPLLTTKKLHLRSIIYELLWFLSGNTNIKYLQDNKVNIWNEWADENGDLGPVYGKQWRDFGGVDQISLLVDAINEMPDSRRSIVTAWNPVEVPQMALPPCHAFFQTYVSGNKLHLMLYQRSGDLFLGVPFNIASYALLQHMLAHVTGYEVGDFIHTMGVAHIYSNHMDQVNLQLTRRPKALPKLRIKRQVSSIFDFRYEDFEFLDYNPDPNIPAPVAV